VGAAADPQAPFDLDPLRFEAADLFDEALRVDDGTVADNGMDLPREDSRGDVVQRELPGAAAHCVARVGAPRIAGNDVETRRQHVDDLAFPLVAPLTADQHDIRHLSSGFPCSAALRARGSRAIPYGSVPRSRRPRLQAA